tara:strand:+ start:3764 stop:4228 length:465 start_codon:yes stop_codon:yes gene_type:complete
MTKTNIVRIETHKSVGSDIIDMIDIVVVDEQVEFNMKSGITHDFNKIVNGSSAIKSWKNIEKHTAQRKQTFRFSIENNRIDNCQMIKVQSRPNNFSSSISISETTKRGGIADKNSDGSWSFFGTHTVPFTKKDRKIFEDIKEVAEKKFQEMKGE